MGKGRGGVISGPTGTGTFATVQNLIKPFIGAGLLALPSAWADGGMLAASILLTVLAFVAGWAIFKLVECCEIVMLVEARHNMYKRLRHEARVQQALSQNKLPKDLPAEDEELLSQMFVPDASLDHRIEQQDWDQVTQPSFADIGACAFGPWGRTIIDTSIVITQFGACTAYAIFISTNLHEVTKASLDWGPKPWVAIFFIPLLSLAMIRRVDKLSPASIMGNFVYLFTIIVIFSIGFSDYCCISKAETNLVGWSHLPFVFGTCSFALEGIPLILPIKRRMANPKDFPRLMLIALLIVSSLYLTFGVLGYSFFHEDMKSPIIGSLPSGPLTDTVKVALSISLFFTFGLQVFPISEFFDLRIDKHLGIDITQCRAIIKAQEGEGSNAFDRTYSDLARAWASSQNHRESEDLVSSGITPSDAEDALSNQVEDTDVEAFVPGVATKRRYMRYAARIIIVFFVCGVALAFPDFKLIIALFGSFTNALLAYILPAMFWIRVAGSSYVYGFDYFPFNREGKPMKHPIDLAPLLSNLNANDISDHNVATSSSNGDDANNRGNSVPISGTAELVIDSKINGSFDEESQRSHPANKRRGAYKAGPAGSMAASARGGAHTKQSLLSTSVNDYGGGDDVLNRLDPTVDAAGNAVTMGVKAKHLWFAFVVSVVGCCSSAIGVVEALRDIVDNFGTHHDD